MLAVAACAAPTPRTATFRARPDDVVAGDLRGPFTGRVVDGANQTPVAGALVYASWSFAQGTGLVVAAGAQDAVVSTDAAGHYRVPAVAKTPPGARLVDFRLLVYKRGFVAYRSDRRFTDFGPRRDFAQTDNVVQLDRWRPEDSHARHLRFVGGGGVVASVTGWETDQAIAEMTQPSGTRVAATGSGPALVAAQLLTEADIKDRTDYDGRFETGPLGDEPDTSIYSSQHYKSLGHDETWDVAVRMWRLTPDQALERYDELRSGLPSVDERDEVASKSLRALERGVNAVVFLDGQRGVVVVMTCGVAQCPKAETVVDLAKLVYGRIRDLWPLSAGGTP